MAVYIWQWKDTKKSERALYVIFFFKLTQDIV